MPIVGVLGRFQANAELVRVDAVHPAMALLDDWELLLALHHHRKPWDGLITTDTSILRQPTELAVLIQTKLTLVVAMESGHNLVKASGLLSLISRASASGRVTIDLKSGVSARRVGRTTTLAKTCDAWRRIGTGMSSHSGVRLGCLTPSSHTTRSRTVQDGATSGPDGKGRAAVGLVDSALLS